MRKIFVQYLHEAMIKNNNIYVITADLGYGLWDKVQTDFPQRFFNVGSSEMTMTGMGIGLALEGKIPFLYSITPFLLYRPFELIRNYIDKEKIPVKLIGGGRNQDYGYLGFSHWGEDDISILSAFNNIEKHKPELLTKELVSDIINNQKPTYLNLKK